VGGYLKITIENPHLTPLNMPDLFILLAFDSITADSNKMANKMIVSHAVAQKNG